MLGRPFTLRHDMRVPWAGPNSNASLKLFARIHQKLCPVPILTASEMLSPARPNLNSSPSLFVCQVDLAPRFLLHKRDRTSKSSTPPDPDDCRSDAGQSFAGRRCSFTLCSCCFEPPGYRPFLPQRLVAPFCPFPPSFLALSEPR